MTPKFVEVEQFTLVGIQIDTTMENGKNLKDRPELRRRVLNRRSEILGVREDATLYGACWLHGPNDRMGHTYMACYQASPGDVLPDGMARLTIPAGRYAVFTHTGKEEALNRTWEEIFRWIVSSGQGHGKGGIAFEVFGERFTSGPDSEHEIYIPIGEAPSEARRPEDRKVER